MERQQALKVYNVSSEHITTLSLENLQQAIECNTRHALNAEARLSIQVAEAQRRGIILSAEAIKYARLDND